jgi:hypothetical protein
MADFSHLEKFFLNILSSLTDFDAKTLLNHVKKVAKVDLRGHLLMTFKISVKKLNFLIISYFKNDEGRRNCNLIHHFEFYIN